MVEVRAFIETLPAADQHFLLFYLKRVPQTFLPRPMDLP